MMAGTCKTCRHWGDVTLGGTKMRHCSVVPVSDFSVNTDGRLSVASSLGLGEIKRDVELWTGPDFGCVHHEDCGVYTPPPVEPVADRVSALASQVLKLTHAVDVNLRSRSDFSQTVTLGEVIDALKGI